MDFELSKAMEVLGRTPATLKPLLSGLNEEWFLRNEGPETWSPFDVVGHLIHGEETDWIRRARIILEEGEERPFEPFDRFAMFEQSKGKSIEQLLDKFAQLRKENLYQLRGMNLTSELLEKRGRHPALGVVTLKQLLATWVVHDLNHIGQIVRVMAKQYGNEVGPWREYLSILTK